MVFLLEDKARHLGTKAVVTEIYLVTTEVLHFGMGAWSVTAVPVLPGTTVSGIIRTLYVIASVPAAPTEAVDFFAGKSTCFVCPLTRMVHTPLLLIIIE